MPQTPKKPARKKRPGLRIESYATLIDKAFNEKVDIIENGITSRVTVFAAIYKKLLNQEITMRDRSASGTRLAYDRFAQRKGVKKAEKIVIVHKGKEYRRS